MRRGTLLLYFTLSLVGLLASTLLALVHVPDSGTDSPYGEAAQILLWILTAVLAGAFVHALVLFRREVRLEVRAMKAARDRIGLRRDLQRFQKQRRLDLGRNN